MYIYTYTYIYLFRKSEKVICFVLINMEWTEKDAYKIFVKCKELQYNGHLYLHHLI